MLGPMRTSRGLAWAASCVTAIVACGEYQGIEEPTPAPVCCSPNPGDPDATVGAPEVPHDAGADAPGETRLCTADEPFVRTAQIELCGDQPVGGIALTANELGAFVACGPSLHFVSRPTKDVPFAGDIDKALFEGSDPALGGNDTLLYYTARVSLDGGAPLPFVSVARLQAPPTADAPVSFAKNDFVRMASGDALSGLRPFPSPSGNELYYTGAYAVADAGEGVTAFGLARAAVDAADPYQSLSTERVRVTGISDTVNVSSPVLGPGALDLYFSRAEGRNAAIQRSRNEAGAWAAPVELAGLPSATRSTDVPRWISADGCRLYFTRGRVGTSALWIAER